MQGSALVKRGLVMWQQRRFLFFLVFLDQDFVWVFLKSWLTTFWSSQKQKHQDFARVFQKFCLYTMLSVARTLKWATRVSRLFCCCIAFCWSLEKNPFFRWNSGTLPGWMHETMHFLLHAFKWKSGLFWLQLHQTNSEQNLEMRKLQILKVFLDCSLLFKVSKQNRIMQDLYSKDAAITLKSEPIQTTHLLK